jgi:hypothetical protein
VSSHDDAMWIQTVFFYVFSHDGVAEKHDFRAIQREIPQISDFAKNQDSNPLPHGDVADDIAKMFVKIFLRKSDFVSKNTIFAIFRSDFCEICRTQSQKSENLEKLIFRFSRFFRYCMVFAKKTSYFYGAKIGFREKLIFCYPMIFTENYPIIISAKIV